MAKQKKEKPIYKKDSHSKSLYGPELLDFWETERKKDLLYGLQQNPDVYANTALEDIAMNEAFPKNKNKLSDAEVAAFKLTNNPIEFTIDGEDVDVNAKDSAINFKSLNLKKLGISPTSLIKPALAVGSLIGNLQQLKKTKKAAKNIKSPDVDAVVIQNRPIESLPSELVNLYKKQIGNLSIKKTADPIANRIAEQMLMQKKLKAIDALSIKQVEQLQKEKARHDKTAALNRKAAIDARNIKSKYTADVYNKKAAIDAAYEAKKQDFINRWIEEGIVKPMEKRLSYNMGREAIQNNADWNRLQAQIVNSQNRIAMEPSNVLLRKKHDELLSQQRNFSGSDLPSYDKSMNYLFTK